MISRSSLATEYRSMVSAASKVTWCVRVLEVLGVYDLKTVTVHYDNQFSLHIARNSVFHKRTKHIEIDCHFTWDKVLEGLLQLTYLLLNISSQTFSPKFYLHLISSYYLLSWDCLQHLPT